MSEHRANEWRSLVEAAKNEEASERGLGSFVSILVTESFRKEDPSFVGATSRWVLIKLLQGAPLKARERLWLAWLLSNLAHNRQAMSAIAGGHRVGRPKSGAKGLSAAMTAWLAIFEGGATSVEQAWVMAAETMKMEPDTVKKHWMDWKPKLEEMFDGPAREAGAENFSAALRMLLRENKKGG